MATKDRTALKDEFKNGNLATGERFADLIDSMKVVQLPVVDPQALGTSLSFIDSISQDADGKITATKKTLDLANAHELNPFKGWYKTGDTLPTDGFDGAYLYFKDTTQNPAVTTIYRWNGTAYADTGTEVDESNVQTFGSGQAVNAMKITPNIVTDGETDKIADARQINNLLDIENHISKNLLYLAEWDDANFFESSGGKGRGGDYRCSLIPCEPDTNYFLSVNSGQITGNSIIYTVLFGAGGLSDFISAVADGARVSMLIHTTSDTRYIGVSLSDTADKPQLELGTSRTSYEEPFEPYTTIKIKESVLPAVVIPDEVVTNELIPNTEIGKIADARQINNLLDLEEVRGKNLLYYSWEEMAYTSSGSLGIGGAYHHMDVPCEPSTSYCLSSQGGGSDSAGNIGGSSVYVVLLDANKNVLSVVGNTERARMVITTTADTAYIGVSAQKAAVNLQLEVGESRTSYEEPFEPYVDIKIKPSVLPPMTIEELVGIMTTEIVGEEEEKIADARQINNLLDAEEVRGKNLLYYLWEEKFYTSSGSLGIGRAYHHMDVPCEPSTSYCLSSQGGGSGSAGDIGGSSVYVVLLDANKNVLSVVGNTERDRMVITTTADTAYIGVSAQKAAVNLQLEVGESRTSYEEPFEPYNEVKIKESMLPPVNIPDGSITTEKLADGISLPASPNMFGRIYASNTELAASTFLRTDFVECFKNISIVVHINSAFTEVQVGLGYHSIYGYSFKIDGTNIILVSGENDTVSATLPHGLTLGSETTFIVDKGVNSAAKITLMNDQGDMYQHNISNFGGQGRAFLRNNGSNAIDAELSFVPKDINQKIWMFGDSYFSYSGNNRWPYYLINNGYVSNLMISRGGDNATEALNSLTTLLGTGARPSYVLWFMGMNAGTDASSGPNATWLEKTQAMIALCSQYGITPVLATIPTIPGASHFYMNEWIRSSGYRYIDCAMAVEVSGSNYWKNWGETNAMLSSDEVHPTSYGAKALYSRVIADFPEITIED